MVYLSRLVRLRLRTLLRQRDMSAYQLAKRAGLSLTTVYRLTRPDGKFGRIEARTLDRICAVIHCKPGDLFERIVP